MGDAAAIAAMSRHLIEPGLPWSWTPKRVGAHMRQKEHLVVVARGPSGLAGFAMAQFGAAAVHLTLLGVAQEYQGQGLGRRLVQWVEDSAIVAGLFEVRLEVRAGNRAARGFYAHIGYRENGVVPLYYSGLEDAIRLSRKLGVSSSPTPP